MRERQPLAFCFCRAYRRPVAPETMHVTKGGSPRARPAVCPDVAGQSGYLPLSSPRLTRRAFLAGAAAALLALPLLAAARRPRRADRVDPWITLAAVEAQLFPSDQDSPGAQEIHAVEYLKNLVADPTVKIEDRRLILDGTTAFDRWTRRHAGGAFAHLSSTRQRRVLRAYARTASGQRWLSTLISYTYEALLSDPVYGGNPGGIGWAWLHHQAGYPRPPADKRYQDLLRQ